jgi:hypothetical protein
LAAAVEVYCLLAKFNSLAKTHLIRRGGSCNQEARAGANSDGAADSRVLLKENQSQSQIGTHTPNIKELGISTGIPLTEYRLDVVSTG